MLEKHFYIESFEYVKNYFTELYDDEVENVKRNVYACYAIGMTN